MTEDDNASGLAQLYQRTRSAIADRTTHALIRLPPGTHLVSSDESGDDSTTGEQSQSELAARFSSYHSTNDLEGYEEDDFEPIPWSPHTSTQTSDVRADRSKDEASPSPMEPRSIQEMKRNPDDLNAFYNILPAFPKPRYQALYDYSSQFSLPALFYFTDISTFGMCWATFLIVGHTIQSLYTDFGPNTGILVLSPEISMLKHIFMDIMWTHSLLSAMMLVPDYFGSSSVMAAMIFASGQPLYLVICLKSHYHMKSQKVVPFVHGEWWIADVARLIFWGYLIAFLCICLGHYTDISNLKVTGVFFMNLTPLFACESYRLLLSLPARLEDQNGHKKHI
ncbi:unnamed protein product [Cylindrotheca closterium]|uniref:Uncharacterized protein n=1 Tax=Cylindrotheca closterium TaxID=2856 RepID=A0AAD2G336_9STRA|nr:unnamed protein product [Cylindrotheca closterium]